MNLMMIDQLLEKEELTNLLNIKCSDVSLLIQGFISNSVTNAQADGVVIGLSGGVDSTVAERILEKKSSPYLWANQTAEGGDKFAL